MIYCIEYLITFIIFFTIDILWLGIVAKKIYKKYLGFIMTSKPNLVAALAFYLLYIIGLVVFVINPAIEKSSESYALFAGLFFGFITYATYDLTNLATLKDWPIKITVIDLIWGSTLCGSVSWIAYRLLIIMNWV